MAMDWDAERLKLVEPVEWYHYPTLHTANEDMRDTCNICGEHVRTGEVVTDDGDGVIHEYCYSTWLEDQQSELYDVTLGKPKGGFRGR